MTLELEVLHLEPCLLHDESCIFLLTEFRDTRQTTVETKFAIHSDGDKKAESQVRRIRRDKDIRGSGSGFAALCGRQAVTIGQARKCGLPDLSELDSEESDHPGIDADWSVARHSGRSPHADSYRGRQSDD